MEKKRKAAETDNNESKLSEDDNKANKDDIPETDFTDED